MLWQLTFYTSFVNLSTEDFFLQMKDNFIAPWPCLCLSSSHLFSVTHLFIVSNCSWYSHCFVFFFKIILNSLNVYFFFFYYTHALKEWGCNKLVIQNLNDKNIHRRCLVSVENGLDINNTSLGFRWNRIYINVQTLAQCQCSSLFLK